MPQKNATEEANPVHTTMDEAHPHVLLVTLDRPPVNAMSIEAYRGLAEVFESLAARPEIRCVILTGAGERAFIAGADVKQLSVRTTEGSLARGVFTRRCFAAIHNAAVPVIAAVNGASLGAGMVIASVCDLIVASERAKFGLPEIDVGALGAVRHIQRILPEKITRQLALTGERVDARFMERFGAVNAVVPHAELLPRAYALADSIASKSPKLMRLRKEGMNLVEEMPVAGGYRVEQLYTTLAASIPDAREAARSVVEKRKPSWNE